MDTKFKQTEIGEIPEDWSVTSIGEVADVTKLAGYEFTKYINYVDDGEIIALRAMNLKKGYLDLSNVKKISKKTSDSLIRSKLFKDDILISYTGTLGQYAMVEKDGKYHLAPNVCRIRTNIKCIPEFLYLYLGSENFQNSFIEYSHGSTQTTVPMKNIREIKIPLPPISEQLQLVDILLSVNHKIELDQTIIKTLEKIRQTLFKRWFIDFEFSNEIGESYKSSGGEMIDSELGEIPREWIIWLIVK